MDPQVGVKYWLVRPDPAAGEISCIRYERFRDGSALAVVDLAYARSKGMDLKRYAGGAVLNADEGDVAWQRLWDDLRSDGYRGLDEARKAGVVPKDWGPPESPGGLQW